MSDLEHQRYVINKNLRLFSSGSGILLVALGSMVLLAWQFNIDPLKQVVAGWPTMKANTALCFLLSGIALIIQLRTAHPSVIVRILGTFIALLGFLTLSEYVLGVDLGIDQLLYTEDAAAAGNSIPGRMGLVTSFCFGIAGSVLATLHLRSFTVLHQILLVGTIYLMLFVVNGFLFDYATIVAVSPLIMVAFHTAVLYILLAVSLLSLMTHAGFMALFVSPSSGGLILRLLYTGTIVVPLATGVLRVLAQDARLFGQAFGNVLSDFIIIVALSVLVTWVARIIHRLDRERSKIQKELMASRELFRKLFEHAPVGMCRFNLDGSGITAVNNKMEGLTGFSHSDMNKNSRGIPWIPAAVWDAIVAEVKEKGMLTDVETTVTAKNGEQKQCLVSAQWFPREEYIELSWVDITERKRAQERLSETLAELERSNKELEQFATVASHDLQAPLQAILGYSELLKEEAGPSVTPVQEEYFDRIGSGVHRMQLFIKDLLLYARVGTQKRFVPVPMNDIMEELMATFGPIVDRRDVTISFGDLPVIRADAMQMKQLLQNLIGNAIKFRRPEPLEISVTAKEMPTEWEFSVSDTGIGIEPQHFERIFVVFQRLHAAEAFEGTGIGLALCKKIVELHKGRIWVTPHAGGGTVFHFTIARQPSTVPFQG